MAAKSIHFARVIFSMMVPLTLFACYLGSFAESTIEMAPSGLLSIVALAFAALGVFLFNWFEEKPQKASIENL